MRQRGFTLIELMIVVAIVGVLAVLATYGVRKYLANAKSAEATNSVGQMAQDAAALYAIRNSFCGSATASVPASITSVAGQKYQSSPSEWTRDASSGAGFYCIHFEIDAPQYYMYSYGVTSAGGVGDSFTATANGDLDGDGIVSTFQLTGAVAPGMAVHIAPNMVVVNGDE